MKDDESRCQFEESWLRRGGESSDLIRYPENHHEIGSGDIRGQYVMDDVQGHWQTWQASRAAIEIELQKPKKGQLPGDYHIGYDSGAESQYESDVEAIRAAGIKVKE
ncbi:hypothetical protein Q2S97_004620 [Escherichia coli]|nr:hypothetical protein [Escherichia coli]